ncbi:MAG: preprotein translocase subunit SecE [Betaproteobacteria bacterium]|nr:preprotein translocase subunit SecE [Betaproteobacteria bacterium]
MADKLKLGIALALALAGIVATYFLAAQPLILRLLAVLAGFGLAAAVGLQTVPGQRFAGFSRDAWAETRKVVWPTRKETLQTTGVVLLLVVVMAAFLMLVDAGLAWAVKVLLGRGS